jgi:hypothetical protein
VTACMTEGGRVLLFPRCCHGHRKSGGSKAATSCRAYLATTCDGRKSTGSHPVLTVAPAFSCANHKASASVKRPSASVL